MFASKSTLAHGDNQCNHKRAVGADIPCGITAAREGHGGEEVWATPLQHEMDHCNTKLFARKGRLRRFRKAQGGSKGSCKRTSEEGSKKRKRSYKASEKRLG